MIISPEIRQLARISATAYELMRHRWRFERKLASSHGRLATDAEIPSLHTPQCNLYCVPDIGQPAQDCISRCAGVELRTSDCSCSVQDAAKTWRNSAEDERAKLSSWRNFRTLLEMRRVNRWGWLSTATAIRPRCYEWPAFNCQLLINILLLPSVVTTPFKSLESQKRRGNRCRFTRYSMRRIPSNEKPLCEGPPEVTSSGIDLFIRQTVISSINALHFNWAQLLQLAWACII